MRATDRSKIIGANIRKFRKAKGYSQSCLAKHLDITFQQIQKYEKGINRVAAEVLLDISAFLQADVMGFFEGIAGQKVNAKPAQSFTIKERQPKGKVNFVKVTAFDNKGKSIEAFVQASAW